MKRSIRSRLGQAWRIARFACSSSENFILTAAVLLLVSTGFRPVGGAVRR